MNRTRWKCSATKRKSLSLDDGPILRHRRRLANYVLRKRPNTFNVFISSDPDWAVQRIMLREHIDADRATKLRNHVNQERRDHCMYCTDSYWAMAPTTI